MLAKVTLLPDPHDQQGHPTQTRKRVDREQAR
jgi:hypothetical protein